MRIYYIAAILAAAVSAADIAGYSGDIVQYWSDQTSLLVNGSLAHRLQLLQAGWSSAAVHGAIYAAAFETQDDRRALQQLAISHAAHDTLQWIFQGTRLHHSIDNTLITAHNLIGIDTGSNEAAKAIQTGQHAAERVARKRTRDGLTHYIHYSYGLAIPDNYQLTPGANSPPDNPQGRYVRLYGGVGPVNQYRASPPVHVSNPRYESEITFVKEYGAFNSSSRTAYDTETVYYWHESSISYWNRFTSVVISQSLSRKPLESAKLFAQLNYALANAAIAAWDSKYYWDHWRPVTAIHRTDAWLPSKKNISDPAWVPLLGVTPSHQGYPSAHSATGSAAARILRQWNGGNSIDAVVSSNATLHNRGIITRQYDDLMSAIVESAESRVFGGIHIADSVEEGMLVGTVVAAGVLASFDSHWDEF